MPFKGIDFTCIWNDWQVKSHFYIPSIPRTHRSLRFLTLSFQKSNLDIALNVDAFQKINMKFATIKVMQSHLCHLQGSCSPLQFFPVFFFSLPSSAHKSQKKQEKSLSIGWVPMLKKIKSKYVDLFFQTCCIFNYFSTSTNFYMSLKLLDCNGTSFKYF